MSSWCIQLPSHHLPSTPPTPPTPHPPPHPDASELVVNGLAHGDELMLNNPANVEENDEHALGRVADLSRLLRSWRCWALPLRKLLFGLRVVPVDPSLVPVMTSTWRLSHPGHADGDLNRFRHGVPSDWGSEAWARTLQLCGAWSDQTLRLPALLGMTYQRWQQCH